MEFWTSWQTNWPIENLTKWDRKWGKMIQMVALHSWITSIRTYPLPKKSKVGQTNRPTFRPTNRQTDIVTYRVACTRLKKEIKNVEIIQLTFQTQCPSLVVMTRIRLVVPRKLGWISGRSQIYKQITMMSCCQTNHSRSW